MRKVTRARSGATRQTILDAASAEMRESGYVDASLEMIAARAGVSKMSIYYHFESKDALCVEAITTTVRSCASQISDELLKKGSTLEALESAVEVIWSHFILMGRGFGSLLDQFRQLEPSLRNRIEFEVASYARLIADFIRRGQERGEIVAGNPGILTQLFIGAIGSTVRWYDPSGEVSANQFVVLLKDTVPRLLIAPSAQRGPATKRKPAKS